MIAMSRDQRDKNGNLVIDGDSKGMVVQNSM